MKIYKSIRNFIAASTAILQALFTILPELIIIIPMIVAAYILNLELLLLIAMNIGGLSISIRLILAIRSMIKDNKKK